MTVVRLLADDLTGALDTAAEFTGLAGPVDIFWHGAAAPHPRKSAAFDTGTRELSAAAAVDIVGPLAPQLAGGAIAYKKLDSLLRGPGLAELAACLRSGAWAHCVLAPAFPYHGRITRGATQFARDHQGTWSAVSGDLVAALAAEGLRAQRAEPGTPLPPGVTVFDAETDAELFRAVEAGRQADLPVLWSGSGGLALALAGMAAPPPPVSLPRPILGLFGSDQGATASQLAACAEAWLEVEDGGIANAARINHRLAAGATVLVSLALPRGLSRAAAAARIAKELSDLVGRLPPPGTLVAAGGETLRAVCLALGADGLTVEGRLVPGLPLSRLRGGDWDGVTVVSKSGAFGHPGLLREQLFCPERTA